MCICNQSYQFKVIALCQQTIAHTKQCITHIDCKGITIEGIDGWQVISHHILILDVIVYERCFMEAFYGNSSTMNILI